MVILDPPSTSIGTKKKRWSAHKDYPELVALTKDLVKPGGCLWTTTNHRRTSPLEFASLVTAGLSADGTGSGWFLERVCAPAVDFPCAGEPAQVKNMVWRAPR